MNSGPTSERAYDAIKQRILSGVYRPGERLDPAVLAETVSSSVTPVRDALNLLTGAGLVTTATSDGFHLPALDEPGVRDLYAWNLEVLLLSIKSWAVPSVALEPDGEAAGQDNWTIARLSEAIAARSSNAEHLREIEALNDRLNAIRLSEDNTIADANGDLTAAIRAFQDDDKAQLSRILTRYHRRRQRVAADIVRACYRR